MNGDWKGESGYSEVGETNLSKDMNEGICKFNLVYYKNASDVSGGGTWRQEPCFLK